MHETPNTVPRTTPASATEPAWPYLPARRLLRKLLLVCMDALLLTLALGLAYQFRFDFRMGAFLPEYRQQFLVLLPWVVGLRLLALHQLGLYRGFTRYTGIYELINISVSCLLVTLLLMLFNIFTPHIAALGPYPLHSSGDYLLRVPWGVVGVDWLLSVASVAGLRLIWRLLAERIMRGESGEKTPDRVLIIGAGNEGEQVARDLLKNYRDQFRPVAFIDQQRDLHGASIHGIPVLGGIEDLEKITQRKAIQQVVIALPNVTPAQLRELVSRCERARLRFQIVPNLDSVIRGHVQISQLRPVEIEDLLGREPVRPGDNLAGSFLFQRCVLVTGAGGSIGSELSRQALLHKPARLLLLGRGENSIYEIAQEIAPLAAAAGVALETIIGDVRDAALIETLFARERPHVVLHAAAHKHVHLMELQPSEAIKNNVLGTRIVAEAAQRHGAERFVMISTDKAVRPTGVMGASKRVAEMLVSGLNARGSTRFISVRFGNVLGSRGSVIPLFRRQIAAGGPVTVTHPEMTRYFMTIPEAVSLVLEAGRLGAGGEVFLLDMGQPVKIIDLARNLITLSGLNPEHDIEIRFTGLRPGEKLFEELLTEGQEQGTTENPKIFRSAQPELGWEDLSAKIDALIDAAVLSRAEAIVPLLRTIITDYQPQPQADA